MAPARMRSRRDHARTTFTATPQLAGPDEGNAGWGERQVKRRSAMPAVWAPPSATSWVIQTNQYAALTGWSSLTCHDDGAPPVVATGLRCISDPELSPANTFAATPGVANRTVSALTGDVAGTRTSRPTPGLRLPKSADA